jgi:hypothetical protein
MRARGVAFVVVALVSCSSGGAGPAPARLDDVTTSGVTIVAGTAAATCPGGTDACGDSGFCCPSGSACLASQTGTVDCGAEYCCLSCTAGSACGGGCCAAGASCVGNPGGATACSTGLCCTPTPEENPCPADVAAACPGGTRCLENRSARYCPGGFACYLPSGGVACPGEVMCPNGVDFCPEGNYCAAVAGVCPTGSTSGNYCCKTYAQHAESCDTTLCAPGLTCVNNPHCANSDPNAAKTCKAPCDGAYPIDCGDFCCPSHTDMCGGPASCTCYYYY